MKILKIIFRLGVFIILLLLSINLYILFSSKDNIIEEDKNIKADAIVILGAGIYTDRPSHILAERLDKGIELYKLGMAPKIIMTGDHGKKYYNEVQVMKNYAMEKGILEDDIFMDHAGFSTYESMARLSKIFQAKSAILVSQKYHLPRSIYLAEAFNIKTYAFPTDRLIYKGQWYRTSREIIARFKDFFIGIFKPKFYKGGDIISLKQSGIVTQD